MGLILRMQICLDELFLCEYLIASMDDSKVMSISNKIYY